MKRILSLAILAFGLAASAHAQSAPTPTVWRLQVDPQFNADGTLKTYWVQAFFQTTYPVDNTTVTVSNGSVTVDLVAAGTATVTAGGVTVTQAQLAALNIAAAQAAYAFQTSH